MDMEAIRTVIRNGRVISTDGEIRADLVIDDHEIVAMLGDSSGVDGDTIIDAQGQLILPGMVETWFPATWLHDTQAGEIAHRIQNAALAGGLTTVAAEPGVAPGDVGVPSHLSLDAAIWLPVTPESLPTSDQLARMKSIGMIGVSATLFGDNGLTDAEVYQLMQVLAQQQLPLAIQPLHGEIRPRDPVSEHLATSMLMILAERTGAWVHLHGVTTVKAVRAAIAARDRGVNVTMSVPALYLALAAESGRSLRVRPPLRSQREVDELWDYVLAEQVDCIGLTPIRSEHGYTSTDAQTVVSLYWHEAVYRRKMSTSQAVRMLSTNPAQILGLYPRKGGIRIGADADLVLFDPDAEWNPANEEALDGTELCPIHGMEVHGAATRVLSHGRTVYQSTHHDDDSLVIPGTGAILHRGM
ncbi:MAG: dihydroorotase family protein [Thermomicrobiales bacterium]|nr:dihydroorotase family protein [Thermomicrobiales bacterium]